LNCTIYSDDPDADLDLGGVIYFDSLSVQQQGGGTSAWEEWQMENFGSTTGPGTGPQEDYDGDGFVNWSEFIAGTQPTNADSYLRAQVEQHPGASNLVIRWNSESGRYYGISRSTNWPAGSGMQLIESNIVATPPENVYTDTVAASWQRYYYRIQVRTNQW